MTFFSGSFLYAQKTVTEGMYVIKTISDGELFSGEICIE
jgi:hypothetical protein